MMVLADLKGLAAARFRTALVGALPLPREALVLTILLRPLIMELKVGEARISMLLKLLALEHRPYFAFAVATDTDDGIFESPWCIAFLHRLLSLNILPNSDPQSFTDGSWGKGERDGVPMAEFTTLLMYELSHNAEGLIMRLLVVVVGRLNKLNDSHSVIRSLMLSFVSQYCCWSNEGRRGVQNNDDANTDEDCPGVS